MNDKTMRTFHVWLLLSDAEKSEFANAANSYNDAATHVRQQINESNQNEFRKASTLQTGPLSGACPYCGK